MAGRELGVRGVRATTGGGVVILAGSGESTRMVYHALAAHFPIDAVIVEAAAPAASLLMRRVKKLGVLAVLGQILFRALAVPALRAAARERIEEVKALTRLDDSPIEEAKLIRVPSVNSDRAATALAQLNPRVVVVIGTRILSKGLLASSPATFINMHAGITPRYRGVHGAYWALVEKDRGACGVTVHLVDAGIDTGKILAQVAIEPGENDNFVTYPLLQLSAGLPAMVSAVANALGGRTRALDRPIAQSKLWSHPTLRQYLQHRWQSGVR